MTKWGILIPAALIAVFLATSCQPDLSAYAKKTDIPATGNASGVCLNCHATGSTYALSNAPLTMQTDYLTSAHGKGALRESTAGVLGFGSAVIENAASCSKCHTTQGFDAWAEYGPAGVAMGTKTQPSDVANTSILVNGGSTTVQDLVSCFACHDPHSQFAMGLRVQAPVNLPSGMTGYGPTAYNTTSFSVYAAGEGNLCANCHQDRTTANKLNSFFAPTAGIVALTNRLMHHGVQADFVASLDSSGATSTTAVAATSTTAAVPATAITNGYQVAAANPVFALNAHYAGTGSPADGCVTCHVTQNGSTVTDHGMYLTTTAAGDNVAVCVTCHITGTTAGTGGALNSAGGTTFATLLPSSSLLSNIATAKTSLLTFFGNPIYFYGSTPTYDSVKQSWSAVPTSALQSSTGYPAVGPASAATADAAYGIAPGAYVPTATAYYNSDYQTDAFVFMTQKEAQAFWNLLLVNEDRSNGIHNPKYAAELLYDAIVLINGDSVVSTASGSATTVTNPWTSRP